MIYNVFGGTLNLTWLDWRLDDDDDDDWMPVVVVDLTAAMMNLLGRCPRDEELLRDFCSPGTQLWCSRIH